MRITYFALKTLQVGEDTRVAGDLVPEAKDWVFLSGYVSDGSIAPVLVATLPEEQQMMLLEWEEEQEKAHAEASSPVSDESQQQATSQPAKDKGKTKTSEKVAV